MCILFCIMVKGSEWGGLWECHEGQTKRGTGRWFEESTLNIRWLASFVDTLFPDVCVCMCPGTSSHVLIMCQSILRNVHSLYPVCSLDVVCFRLISSSGFFVSLSLCTKEK